jgi:hypothetical protein
MPRLFPLIVLCLAFALPATPAWSAEEAKSYDVVIYGGTSAGVTAAIQAARLGKTVVLIEPKQHLGGLTVSGLGMTDSGDKSVIGGLSRQFYQRVKKHYDADSAWVQEKQAGYKLYRPDEDAMWTFEPKVAETILKEMLSEVKVDVVLGESLDRDKGLRKHETAIVSLATMSGKRFAGKQFIDASYEGDLMEAAEVWFFVGRESNAQYGETLSGVQVARSKSHQFIKPVDPFIKPGDKTSGLLPGIFPSVEKDGTSDDRLQAYNYRVCITDNKENQVPFEKPADYDPVYFELLLRNFEAGDLRLPLSIAMMPNRKTDVNNNHAVSTDFISMNYDYAGADDKTRIEILKQHEMYVRGLFWTMAQHERVPESIRKEVSRWGWAKDEFTDNANFPYMAYIREARRMIGEYVQTEQDCRRLRICDDPVGMGSYNMDSHNCQRYVDENGHVRNEGDVQVSPGGPYLISYKAMVPKKKDCTNLLVPVCLSSSHIAYGSIRMEPVFMILGQSAASAACIAIDDGVAIQDVEYVKLRKQLDADGQVVTLPAGKGPSLPAIDPAKLPGVVVDDSAATKTGDWPVSSSIGGFVGEGYSHDAHEGLGEKSIRYVLPIKKPGQYELRLSYTANGNRATNTRVMIHHTGGDAVVTVNQKKTPPIDNVWVSLGSFDLDDKSTVTLDNKDADGHIIADAVQALPSP